MSRDEKSAEKMKESVSGQLTTLEPDRAKKLKSQGGSVGGKSQKSPKTGRFLRSQA